MTATYVCNLCQGPVLVQDAESLSRWQGEFELSIYVRTSLENAHLCAKCVSNIVLTGEPPPPGEMTGEMPF